jgi:L-asparaginase II
MLAAVTVVAEVVRSGLVESVHHGSVIAIDASGMATVSVGDVTSTVYGRSSNKPLQAVAMIGMGLDLPPDQLALVCASHSGEQRHLDVVRRILNAFGLSEHHLQNTPDLPLDLGAQIAYTRAGGKRSSLAQNCSGKHAGMLATCVVNGWPLDGYLQPDHPLQVAIGEEVAALIGQPVVHVGVDGCGAPQHAVTLLGLARAFRTIALAEVGTPEHVVAHAMRTEPELLGGRGRDVTILVRGVPGLVAKDGAEGVYAAAMPDGRAVALKIADGASRARPPVMVAALARLGVDVSALDELARPPVLGHGRPVGEIRALLPDEES